MTIGQCSWRNISIARTSYVETNIGFSRTALRDSNQEIAIFSRSHRVSVWRGAGHSLISCRTSEMYCLVARLSLCTLKIGTGVVVLEIIFLAGWNDIMTCQWKPFLVVPVRPIFSTMLNANKMRYSPIQRWGVMVPDTVYFLLHALRISGMWRWRKLFSQIGSRSSVSMSFRSAPVSKTRLTTHIHKKVYTIGTKTLQLFLFNKYNSPSSINDNICCYSSSDGLLKVLSTVLFDVICAAFFVFFSCLAETFISSSLLISVVLLPLFLFLGGMSKAGAVGWLLHPKTTTTRLSVNSFIACWQCFVMGAPSEL